MRLSAVLLSLFLGLLTTGAQANALVWLDSIEAGRAEAARTGKLLLIHFWSTHCGPCVQLERKVYSQEQVAQSIEQHFVPVKINTEVHPELVRRHAIRFVPTDLVMDASGRILATQKCPPEPNRYLAGLMRLVPAGNTNGQTVAPPSTAIGDESVVGSRYASSLYAPSIPIQSAADESPAVPASASVVSRPPISPLAAGVDPYWGADPQPQSSLTGRRDSPPLVGQTPARPVQQPPATASGQFSVPSSPVSSSPVSSSPAASPSVEGPGLDGMCAVELLERQTWVAGDRRWGAYHRGRLYLFAGELQQQRFLAKPDYYSPVLSGFDPVVAVKEGRLLPGRRQHGVFYNNRVYLFTSEASLAEFSQAPARFAAASESR